ncbi:aldo/keto reductase [Alphaproteobacteria bacterium]|nr:aldo/keto reductase [Alphaproteobacteria bacterium]
MKPILGTVQFGNDYGISNTYGKLEIDQSYKILKTAIEQGIDFIDTAIGYGQSEDILGKFGMKNFKVFSKIDGKFFQDFKELNDHNYLELEQKLINEVKGSLKRLKIYQLEGIFIHDSSILKYKNYQNIIKSINNIKKEGLAKKIGISIYETSELNECFDFFLPDIVQVPMNIFDHRIIESDLMHKLRKNSIKIQVRSIFLQGLLLLKVNDIPDKFKLWKNNFKKWNEFINNSESSALEVLINFILSVKNIDQFIFGVQDTEQLKSIMQIYKNPNPKFIKNFQIKDGLILNPSKWNSLN